MRRSGHLCSRSNRGRMAHGAADSSRSRTRAPRLALSPRISRSNGSCTRSRSRGRDARRGRRRDGSTRSASSSLSWIRGRISRLGAEFATMPVSRCRQRGRRCFGTRGRRRRAASGRATFSPPRPRSPAPNRTNRERKGKARHLSVGKGAGFSNGKAKSRKLGVHLGWIDQMRNRSRVMGH